MSSLAIPILGIDATYRVPNAYAELLFGQGPATASAGVREVVFVMPKLSAGTWVAGTLNRVNTEADAISGAVAGSPLHRAIRLFIQANNQATIWALPVAETSGGSPVAATAVLTIATNATGTGTVIATVAGEDCSYTFAVGQTPTQIGDGIVAAVAAKSWLPVVALNASGVVTFTAKLKGISQGTASLGVIRVRATITSGVGTTATFGGLFLGSGAAGAEGSTTEAANLATALATIQSSRKYYIVSSANDSTSLTNLRSHVSSKSEPKQGLRSVIISAYTGTVGNSSTLAIAKNYERLQIVYQRNSEHDCAELAANMAAIRQKYEQVDSTFNFASYSGPDWLIKAAFDTNDWLSGDEQNTCINDGITPIASNDVGGSYVVMSVDTRSKDSTGAIDDFRACETHRVSGGDQFVDELLLTTRLNYQGMKLQDDERLADGTINPNQKIIRGVLRPSYLTPFIGKLLDEYEDAAILQDVAESKASLRLVKSPANASRVECGLDIHVVDHAHQFTFRIAEVSTG